MEYNYITIVNSTGLKREFSERSFVAVWNKYPERIPFDENGVSLGNYYSIIRMEENMKYEVIWRVDMEEISPMQAALSVEKMLKDPHYRPCLEVKCKGNNTFTIYDLETREVKVDRLNKPKDSKAHVICVNDSIELVMIKSDKMTDVEFSTITEQEKNRLAEKEYDSIQGNFSDLEEYLNCVNWHIHEIMIKEA